MQLIAQEANKLRQDLDLERAQVQANEIAKLFKA